MSFANKVKAKKAKSILEAMIPEPEPEVPIPDSEESKGHNGPKGPEPEHIFSSPIELCFTTEIVEEKEDEEIKVVGLEEPMVVKKLTLKQAMKRIDKMEETMRLIKDLLYNC